ncbi:hypothetical protein FNH13_13620 [Ornithinimicrobium ciconiae]|uniref:Uncharacterized protein n=1 Tax=Ornithinimicrobium ciconiae TaxID=2594265 RepID=A0A516GCJ3_9MICO|nr:hypothetical protein [Ornithinimicrobium ciconiae]QDO89238.1 hypothetical protein FNH13_13620 [Ornithinimicrobium ciconiae]
MSDGLPRTDGLPTTRHLSSEQVRATVLDLQGRIAARFPQHRLTVVATDLVDLVDQVDLKTQDTHRRVVHTTLVARILAAVALLVAITLVVLALQLVMSHPLDQLNTWIPLIDSTIDTIVFIGIAVLFLWAFPERRERKGLLALLHQLRSLAHVLDMHQLTKEPGRLRTGYVPTELSLASDLTRDEMFDYLSYCTELLSLIAKTAALCAERSSDGTILDTVSDVETLTREISVRVYQKVTLLGQFDER